MKVVVERAWEGVGATLVRRAATLVPEGTLAAHDLPALHAAAIHKKSPVLPPPLCGRHGCHS